MGVLRAGVVLLSGMGLACVGQVHQSERAPHRQAAEPAVQAPSARLLGTALAAASPVPPRMPAAPRPVPPGAARSTGRTLSAADAGTYLLMAARAGDTAVVRGLLAAGAHPDHTDEKGYTALILGAYHGHADIVDALLAAGADACQADQRGNTALMGAAFKGYEDIVRRLSTERCQVDQQNGSGRTALMFAAMVGRTGVLKLLEARGAQREQRDAEGRTAADWARTQGLDLPAHE